MEPTNAKNAPRPAIAPSAFVAPVAPKRRNTDELHVCPDCSGGMVYPTDWAPTTDGRWSVDLRCPSCEWSGSGVFTQELVDRFDEALDVATEKILADLQTLSRANMEEEIERFIYALDTGLVQPDDF